ncbi:MAG: ATP synthase F1 subunit delta [Balneolaceae bacterium]
MISNTALRYAKALFDLSLEKGQVESVYRDVILIRDTAEASAELKVFLKSPVIQNRDKEEVLATIFKERVNPLTFQLLQLLSEKSREPLLVEIMKGFIQYYLEHTGVIEVQVESATPLDEPVVEELRKVLERRTGKSVNMQITEEPELMGGLTVRIGDTVIDGSVRYSLERLGSKLKEHTLVP